MAGFSDVEHFTAQRIDPVVVSSNDAKTGDGQCLGRVSLCEDEGTIQRVLGSSIVGVLQLVDTKVRPLTQFCSVDFIKSRDQWKMCVFYRHTIKVCPSCF